MKAGRDRAKLFSGGFVKCCYFGLFENTPLVRNGKFKPLRYFFEYCDILQGFFWKDISQGIALFSGTLVQIPKQPLTGFRVGIFCVITLLEL
ncbi:hypothetical protein F1645_12685 [Novacetimonas hansenii]|uniref:hypothetical protein n=1 Tax=Novacetimonas hansenii TaxID=436 RepID=UPI000A89D525|nr:hypothetical protein [Novacetimonas hansenii]